VGGDGRIAVDRDNALISLGSENASAEEHDVGREKDRAGVVKVMEF
jgi:hypothetical protein